MEGVYGREATAAKAGPVGGLPLSCFSLKLGISPRAVRVARSAVDEEACCLFEGASERGKRNRIDGDRVQSFSLVLPAAPSETRREDDRAGGFRSCVEMENHITMQVSTLREPISWLVVPRGRPARVSHPFSSLECADRGVLIIFAELD